ncbi:hypothetical protein BC829DRAFT_416884 [Chytridium lagenaria]|nr:hypothetical protein BC829DRAFT_416884 [Chytridium lagenaria]
MPAVKPLAVRLTNEGRHRAGSSGNAIASLDTLLHTLSTLTPVGGVSTAPITPSPTTTSSRFTFPVPHSPKSPATASLFVFPPLTHHHHLPGNVSITTSSITSSSGSETRRKSMHSRHSSSATIASDRSGPTMGEVGDGVWAEVAMMTPVASEPPFPLTSTHSVRHSIFEEEVVIIEDGAPSGSLTRYTFSPPPIKHNIPETVYVNANEINIDPAFILEPESPATPNTGYEEERDPLSAKNP